MSEMSVSTTLSKTKVLDQTWSAVLTSLRKNYVSPDEVAFFDQFLDPTKLVSIDDSTAVISTNSPVASLVMKANPNIRDMVTRALKAITQTDYAIKFIDRKALEAVEAPAIPASPESSEFFKNSKLNPHFTFANFVKGNCNLEATQAATIAVTQPGSMNPIFLYSPTGCGKTHLLNAIGNAFQEKFPNKRVLYTSSDGLQEEYSLVGQGKVDSHALKEYLQSLDLLLVDDIQLLTAEKTTNLFFNVFNTLINNGKQIVLASDRAPSELDGLPDRLVSRFSSGLSVYIRKPEQDTMIDILKMKIKGQGLSVDVFAPNVLTYLVAHSQGNVRALEGDLNKLLFTSTTSKNTGKITMDLVNRAFMDRQGLGNGETDVPTPAKVIEKVCAFYHVTEAQIRSKVRSLQVALARQIVMYLCKSQLKMPYTAIGKEFNRDHSTVMYAIRKVAKQVKIDPALAKNLDEISKKLASRAVENQFGNVD